jgi:hypothetical protein
MLHKNPLQKSNQITAILLTLIDIPDVPLEKDSKLALSTSIL